MHTNSCSAKGASATLLEGDCIVMDCVIQFSVISTLIYINTFCTFQVGKFFTSFWHLQCIFRKLSLHSTISHGSWPSKNLHKGNLKLIAPLDLLFSSAIDVSSAFVTVSCWVRNFKPSASIDIFRRASICPLHCVRVTRKTVISSNGWFYFLSF